MAQFKRPDSPLASRHRALGSDLEDFNGVGTAWSYHSDPCAEHDAYRENATLTDIAGLKRVWVRGPDALAVIEHACSRDMANVGPDKCAYTLILTEEGTVTDDAIVYNMGDRGWMVVHGGGEGHEMLHASAAGKNATVSLDDSIISISLQGPKSLSVLNPMVEADLEPMPVFGQTTTRMLDHEVTISRTGFSGERGYEIYAARENIGQIWDAILEAGQSEGVMPASFASLDKVRIEFGLLFYPYDMDENTTPWEINLPWCVAKDKDFRGKAACMAKKGQEKIKLVGLICSLDDAAPEGSKLFANGEEVGVITAPGYSHRMEASIALGHIKPELSEPGTEVEAKAEDGTTFTATVTAMPMYDPQKKNMRN
ncbi:MAG: aminomethyltransferase family protein [Pseudomonadales bacterium]|jgi:aminomethyltransferase